MNLGINLSGAEYEVTGDGAADIGFVFPTEAQLDYYAAKGFDQIRLPLSWERLQPELNGELSETYLSELRDVVSYAQERGISVIIDVHNYGAYEGNLIGSKEVPVSSFANLWSQLGEEFAGSPNVVFGLMNEPQIATPGEWLVAVNSAIAAIREAGANQQILVPGTDWDTANRWTQNGNADVLGKPGAIVDPANNFAFEVHQYLDDTSGQHAWVVSENIGVERLQAITEWARATGNKLYLGEFGVADNPLALAALTKMMDYMAANQDVWEGGSYWAGGLGWNGDYMYSAEPDFGLIDAPQMDILDNYTGTTTKATTLADGTVQVTTKPAGYNVPAIIDLFDASGKLISRSLTDGSGSLVRVVEQGADGATTLTIYEQPGKPVPVTVEHYDANDLLVSQSVTAADGTKIVHDYEPGAHDSTLDSYYDSHGVLLKTVDREDDCVVITNYQNGKISTVEECDVSWQLLSRSTYNANGQLVSKQTDNADGSHTIEQFNPQTGKATTSTEYSASWHQTSATNFDRDGYIASIVTELDGGQKRVELYAPGAEQFSSIETYTADWKIVSRLSQSSDGSFVADTYTAPGSSRVEVRQIYDENWNLQSTTNYGANQKVASIQVEHADGTHTIETYTPTNQRTPATVDVYASDWTMLSRTHLNDKGLVTAVDYINHDNSHAVETFVAGSDVPATREVYSASWQLVSRTSFDAHGLVERVQVDNADGSHRIELYTAANQGHPATVDVIDASWRLQSRTHFDEAGRIASIDSVNPNGTHTVTSYFPDQQVASIENYASDWKLLSRETFAQTVQVADASHSGLTDSVSFDFSSIAPVTQSSQHDTVTIDVASLFNDMVEQDGTAFLAHTLVVDPIDLFHHTIAGYDLSA